MKPKSALRSFLLAGSSLLAISHAHAQLAWDANNTGEGQSGGFSVGSNAGRVTLGSGMTLTGTGNLAISGPSTLQTNAATLSYSGTTTVTGGGILLSFNNLPAGNVTLNNGQISDYYRSTTIFSAGLGTGANQIQIYGDSGFGGGNGGSNFRIGAQNSLLTWGTFEEAGNTNATGFFNPTTLKLRPTADNNGPSIYGQISLQNRLDLNSGTRTINVFRSGTNVYGSTATIGGGIEDTGATGDLIKTGGGTLNFGVTTSTWGGNTTVSGGILDFGGTNINSIGGGADRNISVAAGAVVRFNTLSNAVLNRIVETTDGITVMTGTTSNAFDFSSSTGATLPAAFLSNDAGNGAKCEISGIITPGGGAYRLGAPEQSGALGIRQKSLLSGDNQLIIGGNRVVIVGAHTFTDDTTVRNGGRLGLAAFTGGTNSLALQNSVLDLGAPTATGQIFLEAGSTAGPITGANVSSPASLALGTVSATFGGLKGSKNLVSAFVVGNTGNNTAGTALANITGFTLNVGTGNTFTYSGVIGGFGTGAVSSNGGDSTLTKTGDGTQILDNTNTYTGATTVSAGILGLGATGSIASSASVSIGAGGSLDTSGQASFAIPASQPIAFGVDATGAGSSGKITAAELDITNATVTYNLTGAPDDAVYVLATYLSLTGTAFASAPTPPAGYTLNYAYAGNQIALVSTGGPTGFAAWQAANSTAGSLADDHDSDGVDNGTEYFFGGTTDTTGFTPLPGVTNTGTLSVTWTKAASYPGTYGTNFVVETSSTLAADSWTAETLGVNVTISGGGDVTYIFPAGTKNFARLKVTGP